MKLKSIRLLDKQQLVRVGKRLCLSTIVFFTLPIALVEAQVTPDESLSTNVEQQGENQLNINGGEREGNNLFHSFEEFSIPEGLEAVFENAPDIENIFTRIRCLRQAQRTPSAQRSCSPAKCLDAPC